MAAPEEQMENVRFYIGQIYVIMKPVLLCILLSIVWVKLANPGAQSFDLGGGTTQSPAKNVSIGAAFGGQGGSSDTTSLIVALAILGQIIVFTFIMACLIRFGQIKIIYGIFFVVVSLLLGYFSYQLWIMLLGVSNAAIDWVSLIFFIWNIVVVGILVIFYKGPMYLQQAYLVFMSSLMAYSLSSLPALVTWLLLAMLVVWDLVAVLCPFGPLRMMIESARNQNQEIPAALIYSAMVWMMASGDEHTNPTANARSQGSPAAAGELAPPAENAAAGSRRSFRNSFMPEALYNLVFNSRTPETTSESIPMGFLSRRRTANEQNRANAATAERQRQATAPEAGAEHPHRSPEQDIEDQVTERGGLKLGLGDFVFYSVLVGRASLFDMVTTISTTVAVTTGLTLTILLLALFRKPLPALPISITCGILFYFVSSIILGPFTNSLLVRPDRVGVTDVNDGLWVGKGGGAGLIVT